MRTFFIFFSSPVLLRISTRNPSPPSPGQKLKQPRHRKVSMTTTHAPTSRASPTYVPSTVSACGLWLACDQPPSSLHKETAAVELPAHVRAHSVCLPPFFFFFFMQSHSVYLDGLSPHAHRYVSLTCLFFLADQPLPLCFIQLPPPSSTDMEAPLSSCHGWTPPMCECSVLDLIYTLQTATMRRLWYVPFFFFLSVFVVFSMSHCTLHIFRYYDE